VLASFHRFKRKNEDDVMGGITLCTPRACVGSWRLARKPPSSTEVPGKENSFQSETSSKNPKARECIFLNDSIV
jgi:hypothetical protein